MEEKLKRFRVRTVDGEMFISARNIQEAITLAREQIGALPNDINLNISKNILDGIDSLANSLQQIRTDVVSLSRSLDWNEVRDKCMEAIDFASRFSEEVQKQLSSMLKLSREAK